MKRQADLSFHWVIVIFLGLSCGFVAIFPLSVLSVPVALRCGVNGLVKLCHTTPLCVEGVPSYCVTVDLCYDRPCDQGTS